MTLPKPTLALPERPNLEYLKKEAKRLLDAYRAQDREAVAFVERFEQQPDPSRLTLQGAQRILARGYGFASWAKLKQHLATDAIRRGDHETLRAIVEQSSDPAGMLSARIDWSDRRGNPFGQGVTLLQLASIHGGHDTASTLLSLGAELDLHSACALGDVAAIVNFLKSDGAAIEQQVDTYYPLQFAIMGGHPEAVQALLQFGDNANRAIKKVCWFVWEDVAGANNQMEWKPAHMATLWAFDAARTEVVDTLKSYGADLNACSPLNGYRPIHLAAMSGKIDAIRFLLANSVNVDSRSNRWQPLSGIEWEDWSPIGGYDWTPLMVAAGEGQRAVVDLLIDRGAALNATNSMGQTPLHFAAASFCATREAEGLEIIRLLVARGASVTSKDHEGRQPLDMALSKGYQETAQLLRKLPTNDSSF
jgi:ankyrin repeat protein